MLTIQNTKKGFTLIELLVVISIISLFASVTLAAVQDVRNRGNVAKVKTDMVQIRNAAELYKNDKGSYPTYFSDLIPTYLAKNSDNPFYKSPSGGFSIGMIFTNPVYAIIIGGGGIGGQTINGYAFGLESNKYNPFCGRVVDVSEIEDGKFYVYSSSNIGESNAKFFDKFRANTGECLFGPCAPAKLYNQEPYVYPCLD